MTNLVLIDLNAGPGQWRLKMFEDSKCIGEAVCGPLTSEQVLDALDGWRESMFWKQRDEYLPRLRG